MIQQSQEFRNLIHNVCESCRKGFDKDWILEKDETIEGGFRGIYFWRGLDKAEMPGCVFAFTLEFDPMALSNPPRILFDEKLFHPLVSQEGMFCFPSGTVTCRDPIDEIMTKFINFFNLSKTKVKECINIEALRVYEKDKNRFYEEMRKKGSLPQIQE